MGNIHTDVTGENAGMTPDGMVMAVFAESDASGGADRQVRERS